MNINPIFKPREKITLHSYLEKMGIKDIEEYLNPTGKYFESHLKYHDMCYAVNMIKNYYERNEEVHIKIIQDGDLDGILSTTILYDYLLNFPNFKIKILIHNGKERGLQDEIILETIKKDWCDLVIIPDAGTNDFEQAYMLSERSIDLIVLDHHDYETPIKHGYLINNQNEKYNCNKNGSGTLVTHKFLQALDDEFNVDYSNKYIDLVSLSLISDSMDIKEMENREYLYYGVMNYNNIQNDFLKIMIDKFIRKEVYTQTDLSWSVIPKFNSVCRTNNLSLKQNLILALLNQSTLDLEEVVKLCNEAHKAQIELVSSVLKTELPNINQEDNVIFLASQNIPRAYSGLIAGKISEICDKKPSIVGAIKNGYMIGSVRSPVPIKDTLQQCEFIDFAKGHGSAFGVGLYENNILNVKEWLKTLTIDIIQKNEVLKSYSLKSIPDELFTMFSEYEEIWNQNDLPKPLFHIKGIKVNTKNIKIIGKNKRTIKISTSKYDIIKFNSLREDKENLKLGYYNINDVFVDNNNNENIELEILGYFSTNEWNGNVVKQIIIKEFEVITNKKGSIEDIF